MAMISPHLLHVACGCGHTQTLIRLIRIRDAASATLSEPITRAAHRDEPYQHQRGTDGQHDDDRELFFHKCVFHIVVVIAVAAAWLVYVDHATGWLRRSAERSFDVRRSTVSVSGIVGVVRSTMSASIIDGMVRSTVSAIGIVSVVRSTVNASGTAGVVRSSASGIVVVRITVWSVHSWP